MEQKKKKSALVLVQTPGEKMESPGGEAAGCCGDSNKTRLTLTTTNTQPSLSPQRAFEQVIIITLAVFAALMNGCPDGFRAVPFLLRAIHSSKITGTPKSG